jgi:hypothetical protein
MIDPAGGGTCRFTPLGDRQLEISPNFLFALHPLRDNVR